VFSHFSSIHENNHYNTHKVSFENFGAQNINQKYDDKAEKNCSKGQAPINKSSFLMFHFMGFCVHGICFKMWVLSLDFRLNFIPIDRRFLIGILVGLKYLKALLSLSVFFIRRS
jgi:hypothetical protein